MAPKPTSKVAATSLDWPAEAHIDDAIKYDALNWRGSGSNFPSISIPSFDICWR
jgi:hypothetical protein